MIPQDEALARFSPPSREAIAAEIEGELAGLSAGWPLLTDRERWPYVEGFIARVRASLALLGSTPEPPVGCGECLKCLDAAGTYPIGFHVCAKCGNKRCPHANDHTNAGPT